MINAVESGFIIIVLHSETNMVNVRVVSVKKFTGNIVEVKIKNQSDRLFSEVERQYAYFSYFKKNVQ